tara:strand:+ start:523 stop:1020 length:498 start_codon:yes stop_codon:yes gene_type:complete
MQIAPMQADKTAIDPNSPGFLMNDIARMMRAAFEKEIDVASIGVTAAEARVLAHMARCGASRQNALADRLGMAPMSLTGFLDRLERSGLVQRGEDPQDRRAKIVTLTQKAIGILPHIGSAGQRASDKAFVGMAADERERFLTLGLKVRSNLEAARDTPSTFGARV